MHRVVFLTCTLLACGGDSDPAAPTTTTTTTTTEAEETADTATGTVDNGFDPGIWAVALIQFGVDAEARQAIQTKGYDDNGLPIDLPITMQLLLVDDDIQPEDALDATNSCNVWMTHPGPIDAVKGGWPDAAGAWVGFEMPDDATVTADCDNANDAAYASIADTVLNQTWGFGLNVINDEVLDLVEQVVTAEAFAEIEATSVGGGFHSPLLSLYGKEPPPGEYDPNGFSQGFRIDLKTKTWILDKTGYPEAIPKEEIQTKGFVASGFYQSITVTSYSEPSVLLQ
jgi:hypothetical protein